MPADGISVTFSPQTMKKFSNLILEMQKSTGAELKTVVRNVGRDFVKQAVFHTPIAPATVPVNVFRVRKKNGDLVEPAIYYKGSKTRAKTQGRGFAKSGWLTAMYGLGMVPKINKYAGKSTRRVGHFRNGLRNEDPFVEIGNKVPYIGILDTGSVNTPPAHIVAKSIRGTEIKMEETLTRLSRKLRRKWRS